jgi:hypothetical protein
VILTGVLPTGHARGRPRAGGQSGGCAHAGREAELAVVSEGSPLTPLQYWLFTPEIQWQSRGTMAYLTGATGNARTRAEVYASPLCEVVSAGCGGGERELCMDRCVSRAGAR